MVPRSDALRTGPWLRRQGTVVAGLAAELEERVRCLASPLGEVSWQRENCKYFWKSFKSTSAPLWGVEKGGRAAGIIGTLLSSPMEPLPATAGSVLLRAVRAEAPAPLTSSPHTSHMCFSVPISYSQAPAESINCHNQCRLFSIPQDAKQTKQSH